ncbi:site-specific integrase [Edaphobacter aggregans]|uniref:site-specific integrase n=1 Tax=Edaphobacter aggregans TaxID=570835 RepID=UPI000551A373|nr:site-specific integrase [Edaphobacter aggregans]
MTHLRKIMLEELQRRNYSDSTIRHYLHWVEEFARHFDTSPDKLGLDHLRAYQAYLLKQRKLAVGSVVNHVAALRFLYVRTLKRPITSPSTSNPPPVQITRITSLPSA